MSENFHGGSLDIGGSDPAASNVIELNNLNNTFFFPGPKKASGEDFGSLDSSDTTTYLSCCNTHPFPSQGSLAGLEALAAQGSMAANGSINNSVYVNPFDPGRGGGRRGGGGGRPQTPPPPSKAVMMSPRGSPQRRVRIAAGSRRLRSRSSDLCDDLDLMERMVVTGMEGEEGEEWGDNCPPKHRRARRSQVRDFCCCSFCVNQFLFARFPWGSI
jgi:hypothetical protein